MLLPLLIVATLIAPTSAGATDILPDSVRIRLLGDMAPAVLDVRAPDTGLSVRSGPASVMQVEGRSLLRLRVENGEVRAESGSRMVQAAVLTVVATGSEPLAIRAGDVNRSYRGTLTVSVDAGSLRLVNTVELDEYVASVVASEYALDDLEGTKAMAVVARTYAVRGAGHPDAAWDHDDHEGSQVYRGAGSVTQIARIAAEDTRGEVLTWQGQPIEAVYSSSSGGHTANNEDVWNSAAFPYLRGRDDPWDRTAPHHEWRWSVDRTDLDRVLEKRFGVRPRSLSVADRSRDGRARRIRIEAGSGQDRTVDAAEFRVAVVAAFGAQSLRSTLFDVDRTNDRYVFDGHGYGHGVGLSQWGAHGMALAGKSYREILDFYYRDVRLDTWEPGSPATWLLATRSLGPGAPTTATDGAAADVRRIPSETRVANEVRVPHEARSVRRSIQAWGNEGDGQKRTPPRRVGW